MIKGALLACGVVTILTTAGILLSLASETIQFFSEVSPLEFFTGTDWAPSFADKSFGVLPLINGTLMVTGIAVLFSVPVGLAIAIYLSEYASPRIRSVLKPFLELLAGIPTVVLGFFALTFVTQVILKSIFPQIETFNALSAGLVVGLMIVPTIASLSEDALRAVPGTLREGAYGLGASKRVTALKIIVPAALSGLSASIILATSRAIGETMIVAIAANSAPDMSFNPLKGLQTMTAYIVQITLGDAPAGSIVYKTVFAVGATLFAMTFILNAISIRIVRKFKEVYD